MSVLDLRYCKKIKDLIYVLNEFQNNLEKDDSVNVKLKFGNFTNPELLPVCSLFLRNLKREGKIGIIENVNTNLDYLSRCNFLKSIEYNYKESFFRRRNKNLVELTILPVKQEYLKQATDKCSAIIKLIKENYKVDSNIYSVLNFCLWEVIDNVFNHSESKDEFSMIVQNFPTKNELNIAVVDNGIGIHQALISGKSEFNYLTARESLKKCIEKSVTNGKGQGNGLFYTKKFILKNKGEFLIYSGSYCLWINKSGNTSIERVSKWRGTIIFMKIKTNNLVDIEEIFENNIPTSVDECEEMIGGLW